MTRVLKKVYKCKCGNDIELSLYASVNISLNPELKKLVIDRKVNNLECSKCGDKEEIIYQFLYHDMDSKKMIWCYPEFRRSDKEEIMKMLIETAKKLAEMEGGKYEEPILVFGYDELLKLI